MQEVKMTDQIAGHENDGPKMTAGRKMAGEKSIVSTEITFQ